MTSPQTCATCRFAVAVRATQPGFDAASYRHCQHSTLRGLPIDGWLIAAKRPCAFNPSRWEAAQ